MSMELSPAQLFDAFPEAVLLVLDATVRYSNPAAGRLFPGLSAGGAVPAALAALLEGAQVPAVLSGELEGSPYTVTLQQAGDEVLVVLRTDVHQTEGRGLQHLAVRLRQETAGMAAALQRLDPTVGEPGEEKAKRYLAAASQGLYRLMRLADHLEFVEREDEEVYRPGPLDLAGFCRDLADQIESVCRLAGYRFTYETELSSLVTTGDERLLRRLVLSLVSNSIKAVGEGGYMGLRLSRQGEGAVLTVWDRGGSLAGEELSRMLGGAVELRSSLDPSEGLGLGMDAVRRIARLHGGTVFVESNQGKGLQCVVSLPVQQPEGGLPLRSPKSDYSGGFSPLLVELSDVLPVDLFFPEHLGE